MAAKILKGGVIPTWERESVTENDINEDFENDEEKQHISQRRLSIKPLNPKYAPIYNQWEKHVASFWTHKEIEYKQDIKDWLSISEDERYMLGGVIAFFAGGDTLINANIAEFASMVPDDYLEVKLYWSDQMSREGIHSVTYAEIIESICSTEEQEKYLNAIKNWKSIADMSDWMSVLDKEYDTNIDNHPEFLKMKLKQKLKLMKLKRLGTSVIVNICAEGIFFSAAFSFIFWFKSRGLFPGISFANEKISIDEANHAITAVIFYLIEFMNSHVLSHDEIKAIFKQAVKLAIEFINDFVPEDFGKDGDFNRELATQYVQYVADFFLVKLGIDPIYGASNPFSFMNLISLMGKTNFFEKRVGEYNKADVSGWKSAIVSPSVYY